MGQNTSRSASRRQSRQELDTSLAYEKAAKAQALESLADAKTQASESRAQASESRAQASRLAEGWRHEQELREREEANRQNELAQLQLQFQMQLAAYHLHFCVRTLLDCLMRLTFPARIETGGALFKRFITSNMVDASTGTRKLNESARQLYHEIRNKLPEFIQSSGDGNASWLAELEQTYLRLNEQAHSFPNIPPDDDQIIACGGAFMPEIMQQVVVIAAVQKYLKDHPGATTPRLFPSQLNDVAVLYIFAPGQVRMLGRVTDGDFSPAATLLDSS